MKKCTKKYTILAFVILIAAQLAPLSTLQAEYWKKVTLPATANYTQWLDVFFLNETHGWVCGRNLSDYRGRVARTTDGGATWSIAILPIWFLESIHFVDPYNGFCSGPDGVYKSTDGGISWTPITYLNILENNGTIDIWGCYMLNKDTIYVAGGGCSIPSPTDIRRHRLIWRSEDAGDTWTPFSLSYIPLNGSTNYYSGLTDVMVHPNGTGYASSSGLIWKTDNYGDTWEIASRTSVNLSWQEEITNIYGTNSVLVPYSGVDCSGGATNTGGMRFSTNVNNAASWRERPAAGPMYGSFLTSATTGWACGTYRGVYYTSDAGDTWQLRNCGIEAGDNLDDIWFITPQKGWVVGDNIYRLAPSEMLVNKDSVDFGDSCTSRRVYDTITIKNMNFEGSIIDISVYQNNPNFSIILPSYLNYTVPACGEVKLVVRYAPTTIGKHNYSVIVKLTPTNISEAGIVHRDTIYYTGTLREFSAKAEQDTIDFGDVPVKTDSYKNLKWLSQNGDTIISYVSSISNTSVTNVTMPIPFAISDTGRTMRFMVAPVDTGIMYVIYTFKFGTCDEERKIVLKVRGISPVISSNTKYNIDVICKTDTIIKIPIHNTGNAPLEIYTINFAASGYQPEILGFASNNSTSIIIGENKNDTLIVRFSSNSLDTQQIRLFINHNDSKRSASVSPTIIDFTIIFYKTMLSTDKLEINFGDVCIGNSATQTTSLKNLSNHKVYLAALKKALPEFTIDTSSDSVASQQNASYSVKFAPKLVGVFADTLEFAATPCETKFKLILRGRGVENNVAVNPEGISDKLNINITKTYDVDVISSAIQLIEIKSAEIIPELPELDIKLLDNFSLDLPANSTKKIYFSISSSAEFTYSGTLILYLESACFDTLHIPINIEFVNNNISYTDNQNNPAYKFSSYVTCLETTTYDTIWVSNTQPYIFKSLYFDNSSLLEYKVLTTSEVLPAEVDANGKIMVVTSFTPIQECNLSNNLIFEIVNKATGEIQFDTLYYQNEFKRSNIQCLLADTNIDFGLFETCDDSIMVYIPFNNTGTLRDTLVVTSILPEYYEILDGKFELELLPQSKDSLAIVFYPNRIQANPVANIDILQIVSSVCPKDFSFNLQHKVSEIALEVSPQILDFNEVWINTYDTLDITLRNPSEFAIELTQVSVNPDSYFEALINLPIVISANSEIKLPVRFSANKSDSYSANITISVSRSCMLERSIDLMAIVPTEKYYTNLYFDSTSAKPGTTATISAYIHTPVPELEATGIDFSINMNNSLFFPEKVYLLTNNNKKELEFDFTFKDGLSAKISGIDAQSVLSSKQKFLEITGLALLYQPDITSINFNKFDITTNKFYEILQTDGEFKLKDYCGVGGQFRGVTFLPTIEPKYQDIISNNLQLNIVATGEISLIVQLVSSIGEIVLTRDISAKTGANEYEFDVSCIGSGVYSIRFITEYYPIESGKIAIIK